MVFKRKSAGRNGDQPRKRGRWAKRSPVAEEKDEAKEQAKEVIEQVSGEGTAAAPLKIKVSGANNGPLQVLVISKNLT